MMDLNDLIVRASWLYHVEGLTQAQIADRLHLTRRRVNEMLAQAHRDGVVKVSFNSKLADCVALEAELSQRFGLEDAIVVPTPEDASQIHKIMGRAVAAYLDRFIAAHNIRSFGVAWGSTLRETIQFMTPQPREDMEVHSMTGGLTQGTEINTFEIVRGFAQVFSAHCRYFVAPIYAESPESRDAIISQTVFRRTYETICNVDLAYFSVGDASNRSLQVRYGLPEGIGIEELKEHGAVGDLAGRFLNAEGKQLDHTINRQVLAPELTSLKTIRHRLIVGGGAHKIPIVTAILNGGYPTILAIDAESAKSILGH